MEATRVRQLRAARKHHEELNLLRLALSHVEERLIALTPGINTTYRFYKELLDDRVSLTNRISQSILYLYENSNKTNYVYFSPSVTIPYGRTLRTRI